MEKNISVKKFVKIVRRMGQETEIGERQSRDREHLGKWNPIKSSCGSLYRRGH